MIKPILFNTDMVRAIQSGTKTATRRVVKPQPFSVQDAAQRGVKPPYHPGGILYVRETWQKVKFGAGPWHFEYKADCTDGRFFSNGSFAEWRPSIHMPREAARIFLRVTDVRVEQLYCITGKQAKAEGFLTRDGFIRCFLTMYPDCTVKSWVWVIEFDRCEKPEGD